MGPHLDDHSKRDCVGLISQRSLEDAHDERAHRPAFRILVQPLLRRRLQPVELRAHVHRLRHEDPGGCGAGQHIQPVARRRHRHFREPDLGGCVRGLTHPLPALPPRRKSAAVQFLTLHEGSLGHATCLLTPPAMPRFCAAMIRRRLVSRLRPVSTSIISGLEFVIIPTDYRSVFPLVRRFSPDVSRLPPTPLASDSSIFVRNHRRYCRTGGFPKTRVGARFCRGGA